MYVCVPAAVVEIDVTATDMGTFTRVGGPDGNEGLGVTQSTTSSAASLRRRLRRAHIFPSGRTFLWAFFPFFASSFLLHPYLLFFCCWTLAGRFILPRPAADYTAPTLLGYVQLICPADS